MAELHYHTVGGYAGVRIHPNRSFYEAIEPFLHPEEKKEAEALKEAVLRATRLEPHQFGSTQETMNTLSELADGLMRGADVEKKKIYKYYLLRDLAGAGRLEPLLRDENIELIHCEGAGLPVEATHRDFGALKTNITLPNSEAVEHHARKIRQRQGLRVEEHPGGFTVEARKKQEHNIGELVSSRLLPKEMIAHAWIALENKEPIIITGGDEATRGKLLNAISTLTPPFRRIISIEHTRSLKIPHRNWTALVTHDGYGPKDRDGKRFREKTFEDTLNYALDKRPDQLILRECKTEHALKCGGCFIATLERLHHCDASRLPRCMLLEISPDCSRITEASLLGAKPEKICEWDGKKGSYVFHKPSHEGLKYKMRALEWIGERGYHPPFFGIFSEER